MRKLESDGTHSGKGLEKTQEDLKMTPHFSFYIVMNVNKTIKYNSLIHPAS